MKVYYSPRDAVVVKLMPLRYEGHPVELVENHYVPQGQLIAADGSTFDLYPERTALWHQRMREDTEFEELYCKEGTAE